VADGPGPGPGPRPEEGAGPGFTEVGLQGAVPFPGPDSPPRNEWSDWYGNTEPRSPFVPPASPPPADQPPAYQQQQQPMPPMPYPGHQQPYRPPFEPPPRGPSWPQAPSGPPPRPGPSPRPGNGGRRSRAPLFWSALSAAVAVAVVVIVLLLHPFNHHETVNDAANSTKTAVPSASVAARASTPSAAASAPASPSSSASTSASASASSTAVTERQAASNVAGMLASSVTDRTAINNAYNDVYGCGPNLHSDAAVFTRAVSSRRALLASLATMPGRSALPPALLSNLAQAWQASMAADQGLATWANDEVTQGCVAGDTSDPAYRTTIAPDSEATQDKTAFTTEWNPIAARYDLTTYQQGQL
jgi:hypothetical protein